MPRCTPTINVNDARIVTSRIFLRLIIPIVFAITMTAGHALAQDAFRAPLLEHAIAPATSVLPFLQIGIAPSIAGCKGLLPLRNEAERRGQLIKAAVERHAGPDDACKMIRNFSQTETKMIEYIAGHPNSCAIPLQIVEMLKADHRTIETVQIKVCRVAQANGRTGGGLSLSEVMSPTKRDPAGAVGDFGKFQ
jgi:hypothetical protein